ncbi:type II secretion system minor pseudopilin GspK [Pseudomonas solani]|uniref:Type II secretion system protein K n=1 Tax=Pseudomonas solani TaxID=2731552 RepID=A0AAU7XUB7_9PSED
MHPLASQRGMAVISALLIAAVVAVIAAGMIARQTRITRAVESENQRLQGAWAARGVLEWSRQRLWEERLREPSTRLDQAWAQPLRNLSLGEGTAFEGAILDEQGRFNLRNLVRDEQLDPLEMATFERLCALLGVSQEAAARIARRVIDAYAYRLYPPRSEQANSSGFDSGRLTSPEAQNRAFEAKRPMLRRLEDLADLPGVPADALQRLAPFVTLLPMPTWVNGNTASAEVIAARVPGLGLERARALIAERDRGQWFINSGDVLNRLRMPDMTTELVRIGITSEWFLVRGLARAGERRSPVEALLFRAEESQPRIVWSRVGA